MTRGRITRHAREHLGQFGIWRGASQLTPELAAGIERAGGARSGSWLARRGPLGRWSKLLDATSTLTLATGIVNMWQDEARTVAASFAADRGQPSWPVPARRGRLPPRGHPGVRQALTTRWPATSTCYSVPACPPPAWCWPRWARKCCGWPQSARPGAHPYLVTPCPSPCEARRVLGAGPLLAPGAQGRPGRRPGSGRAPRPPPGAESLPRAGQLQHKLTCAAGAGLTTT